MARVALPGEGSDLERVWSLSPELGAAVGQLASKVGGKGLALPWRVREAAPACASRRSTAATSAWRGGCRRWRSTASTRRSTTHVEDPAERRLLATQERLAIGAEGGRRHRADRDVAAAGSVVLVIPGACDASTPSASWATAARARELHPGSAVTAVPVGCGDRHAMRPTGRRPGLRAASMTVGGARDAATNARCRTRWNLELVGRSPVLTPPRGAHPSGGRRRGGRRSGRRRASFGVASSSGGRRSNPMTEHGRRTERRDGQGVTARSLSSASRAGERAQAAVGEDPDRARSLAHDGGDVGDVEPRDRAEEHGVALGRAGARRSARARPRSPSRSSRCRRGRRRAAAIDAVPSATGSTGIDGRRASRRKWSMARRRATVNSHARNAVSSPSKRTIDELTAAQVSDATSSAASPVVTRR